MRIPVVVAGVRALALLVCGASLHACRTDDVSVQSPVLVLTILSQVSVDNLTEVRIVIAPSLVQTFSLGNSIKKDTAYKLGIYVDDALIGESVTVNAYARLRSADGTPALCGHTTAAIPAEMDLAAPIVPDNPIILGVDACPCLIDDFQPYPNNQHSCGDGEVSRECEACEGTSCPTDCPPGKKLICAKEPCLARCVDSSIADYSCDANQ